ncbi:MAG: ATP-binding protein, partial [Gemmatimonadales bacterium]
SEIKKAAERSALLTRQLLAFSRKQLVEHTVFDLSELVRDMDKMIRRLIGEDVELMTRTEEVDPVRADRGQIEQLLLNLVVNARDAMPRGGKLVIQTRNATLDDEYVGSHPGASAGEYVMLVVSDSGTGMTDEVQANIFEPFFTTKEDGTGTGLGLATCYGIVKQLGGYIGVYSEVGVGTTMKVYLPCAAGTPEPVRTRAADELPRGTETILLVEDDDSVRLVAARVLRRQGYTVLEASNGEEAMSLLGEHQREVQLLLTDVVLPGAGGRAVAEMAQAVQPGIKVLFATGYTDDAILRHRLRDQEVELLSKPFTLESLTRRVREALDARDPSGKE